MDAYDFSETITTELVLAAVTKRVTVTQIVRKLCRSNREYAASISVLSAVISCLSGLRDQGKVFRSRGPNEREFRFEPVVESVAHELVGLVETALTELVSEAEAGSDPAKTGERIRYLNRTLEYLQRATERMRHVHTCILQGSCANKNRDLHLAEMAEFTDLARSRANLYNEEG